MAIPQQDFYSQDTVAVARALVGLCLVRQTPAGPIVCRLTETEAYTVNDRACHAFGYHRTQRTDIMFGSPGRAYIYLVYGLHHCANIVTEQEGTPCAVLLRCGEILAGLSLAAQNRFSLPYEALSRQQRLHLADGPGKLARAMALTRAENGVDLTTQGPLFVTDTPSLYADISVKQAPFSIAAAKRVGIDYAGEDKDLPWRFILQEAP